MTKQKTKTSRVYKDVEQAFINAYLQTHSVKEAAKMVGRSYNWATKIFNREDIMEEISQRQLDSANRADITNEWLIEEIKEVAMAAKGDGSWNAALNGLKMLGEIKGLFDKRDMNGITYNMMGSVILAPSEDAAKKLLANPDADIEGEYEVMQFNIGEEVE